MPIGKSEEAIVFAAKNGNGKCFEELYKLYYDKIYAIAYTMVKNSTDAEDILQNTFIKAWQNINRINDPAAFNTWLQRITINECNAILRKKKPDFSIENEGDNGELLQFESDLMLPEQYAERADLSERLKKIIDDLSVVQKETILLYYYSEMSIEEIAQTMDCSQGTVKSRLFLARKAIKTEIEEKERKTGERFYSVQGIALVPFAILFVSQIKSCAIPADKAMLILSGIAKGLGNAPVGYVTPAAGANSGAGFSAGTAASSGAASGAAAGATSGAAASSAMLASIPMWAKIVAAVTAAALFVAGLSVGLMNLIGNNNDNDQIVPIVETVTRETQKVPATEKVTETKKVPETEKVTEKATEKATEKQTEEVTEEATEAPDNSENWKDIYAEKIEEKYSGESSQPAPQFALVYIDDDDVPELLMQSGSHSPGLEIYWIVGDETESEHLGLSWGEFLYNEKQGDFYYEFNAQGTGATSFFFDGSSVTTVQQIGYTYMSGGAKYEIDGESVDKASYEREYESMRSECSDKADFKNKSEILEELQ